jgi:lambda family phage minor tail protein L
MSSIARDLASLDPNTVIELFVIDAEALGGSKVYLHNHVSEFNGPIYWQGQAYQAFPIEAEGFDQVTSGPHPRPTLRVANVMGLVGALVRDWKGLRGAKVIRKRTLAKYLDAVNFAAGNASANPDSHYMDDLWTIDRRAQSNHQVVSFELASPIDAADVELPKRQILELVCIWQYRGPDCGYTGPAAARADDTPTTNLSEDKCSQSLRGCMLRDWPDGELPFGGFPGSSSIQQG